MTVKELSNFSGKTERTVRQWVAKAGDKVSQAPYDKMSQGIPHDFIIGSSIRYSRTEIERYLERIKVPSWDK